VEEKNRPLNQLPLIKVVGISASGKSTLVTKLRQAGYNARPVSQEHSHITELWRQFEPPSLLIYLETTLEAQRLRRPDVTWEAAYLQTERMRLAHARDHADLRINTAALTPDTVWQIVKVFIQQQRIQHADQPLAPLAATGSALRPTATVEATLPAASNPRRRKKRRKRLP